MADKDMVSDTKVPAKDEKQLTAMASISCVSVKDVWPIMMYIICGGHHDKPICTEYLDV